MLHLGRVPHGYDRLSEDASVITAAVVDLSHWAVSRDHIASTGHWKPPRTGAKRRETRNNGAQGLSPQYPDSAGARNCLQKSSHCRGHWFDPSSAHFFRSRLRSRL